MGMVIHPELSLNYLRNILFFGFCFIVIVVFILFLNLNHIGNAVSEVVPQSDLTVSYDVSAINPETSNVTITIHASSDVGLKRILLPNKNRQNFSLSISCIYENNVFSLHSVWKAFIIIIERDVKSLSNNRKESDRW